MCACEDLAADLASGGPLAQKIACGLLARRTARGGAMTEVQPKPRRNGGHWKKREGLAQPGNGPAGGPRPAFQPGHEVNLTHGTDPRGRRVAERLSPVADVITASLLEMPQCPDWLKDPSFAYAISGWANAEARLLLYETWMDAQSDEVKYLATGAQEPLISRWTRLSELAARHRGRLGLDPVSRVRIGKALTSAGVDIAKLAAMEYGRGGDEDEALDGQG